MTLRYGKYGCSQSSSGSYSVLIRDGGDGCATNEECFYLADNDCKSQNLALKNYEFIAPNNYPYECAQAPDPAKDCEETIEQYCANNFGLGSSDYTDNGDGSSSCTGTCTDGTPAVAPEPEEECNLANNYCDVDETPSDLDFGSGNSGSDGGSSSETTTDEDPENDIDYEPDGSGSSASENGGMSSLQGDKLINEVIASRNDNTKNLASTTDTTNQTIVEKSDDIQETISNSANGIIDAINNDTPFYDGNIVDAINGLDTGGGAFDDTGIIGAVNSLGTGIEGLGDKIDDLGDTLGGDYIGSATPVDFGRYTNIFHGQDDLEGLTNNYKQAIGLENRDFMNTVKDKFIFSSGSGSYQTNNLDLGKWGSHDISIARFVDYFGGVGNIIYFLLL